VASAEAAARSAAMSAREVSGCLVCCLGLPHLSLHMSAWQDSISNCLLAGSSGNSLALRHTLHIVFYCRSVLRRLSARGSGASGRWRRKGGWPRQPWLR
jgi:hypothetical protein